MSDEGGAPTTGGIENNIRAAYDRLPEIEAKRKTVRLLKLFLPLAVLGIVLIGLYSLWGAARANVVDRKEELTLHFKNKTSSIIPRVERQAKESAERVLPRLQQELGQAQRKAQESLRDVFAQRTDGMGKRLEEKMNAKLDEELVNVNKTQRLKMQATFPGQLKCNKDDTPAQCEKKEADLDRVMDEIQRSYRDWAIMEMRTTFDQHLKAMDTIRATMGKFKAPSGKGKTGEGGEAVSADAPAEMMMLFLELAAEYMGGSSDLFEKQED